MPLTGRQRVLILIGGSYLAGTGLQHDDFSKYMKGGKLPKPAPDSDKRNKLAAEDKKILDRT